MKYVVCYSGGHSSAIVAIETVRKYGKENVILLNHDISSHVELDDIKRFKNEVANYLELPITFANHPDFENKTPVEVAKGLGGFKFGSKPILCTYELKTKPFYKWLKENDPNKENVYLYGFDNTKAEIVRMHRRSQKMGQMGYKTDYPLILWERTIESTKDIGIEPPNLYDKFKHANCIGCLKAGWQHWYTVYCERPDIWNEAKDAEDEIGYSIHIQSGEPIFLEDKEEMFKEMKELGIIPNEHINSQTFWTKTKKELKSKNENKIDVVQLDFLEKFDEGVCLDCTV